MSDLWSGIEKLKTEEEEGSSAPMKSEEKHVSSNGVQEGHQPNAIEIIKSVFQEHAVANFRSISVLVGILSVMTFIVVGFCCNTHLTRNESCTVSTTVDNIGYKTQDYWAHWDSWRSSFYFKFKPLFF